MLLKKPTLVLSLSFHEEKIDLKEYFRQQINSSGRFKNSIKNL